MYDNNIIMLKSRGVGKRIRVPGKHQTIVVFDVDAWATIVVERTSMQGWDHDVNFLGDHEMIWEDLRGGPKNSAYRG